MIRKIDYSDIDGIIKLENETINTTLGKEMLDLAVRSEMAYYYVYLDNDNIVGYISSSFDGITIEILNFCVYKEYQNKGIGTKLICHLLDELYIKGANNSILEVRESNQLAIRLYERIGYKKINVRKNYYSNGENALVMQKLFTPYSDIYRAYMENVSVIKKEKDYISYRNDNFKEKYDFNKYELLNEDNLDKVIKKIKKDNNRSFLEIECNNRHNDYFIDMVESSGIIMHTNINNIRLDINHNNIKELNDDTKDDYLKYNYEDDLQYDDIEYAKKNGLNKLSLVENKSNQYKSYLIYDDNKLIGMVDTFIFLDNAYFENFVILEEYRLKGYGRSLFMGAINKLKSLGIKELFLEADNYDTVKEMYQKWGFSTVLKTYSYHEDY